ncbi:membrane protein [Paucisalibacillus sp. EB02]|uniref:membrane protein n=1 Tax=Paucisalibacillus sp. EB02 TaxID=1347087 RepID=UPI0004B3FFB5|nr:membrane protein [Paucisalibacillus sp. EB02]
MTQNRKTEVLFWSIALPGFGQYLNGKIIKGTVLILLEFIVNVKSGLNYAILPSFYGNIQEAIAYADFQWLMFYPCLYLFAMWDAYRDAGGGQEPYAFLPFVFAAFLGTVGVVYSPIFNINGVYFGVIWLPIIFLIIGVFIGKVIRKFVINWKKNDSPTV